MLKNTKKGIKDRHNGNIMLKKDGRVAHIDFGFVFGMAPGKDKVPYTNFSMERAPFKLTHEMAEVMGGEKGKLWKYYVTLMTDGMLVARKNHETIITLIEIMGFKSRYPCFQQPGGGLKRVLRELKQRIFFDVKDSKIPQKIEALAKRSLHSRGTILYEKFQKFSNDIEPIL